jgi:hypothetical protein
MSEQATPEVTIKKAPKRQPKPPTQADDSPTTPESEKRLAVVSKELHNVSVEIRKLEALKAKRLELIKEAHSLGMSTKELNLNTGTSVARLRQLLAK